jgi:hypothetical protein
MDILPFKLPDDAESRYEVLSRRAIAILEDGTERVPNGVVPSFRLWHYPATGTWFSWTLFVPPGMDFDRGSAWARESSWDADRDREHSPSDLQPSITEYEGGLAQEIAHRILREGSFLGLAMRQVVKPFERSTLTRYGIEGYAMKSNPIRVEWDSPVPVGLGAIAAWHSRTRAALGRGRIGGRKP